MRTKRVSGFDPVVGRKLRVLVLGTMPGTKSLATGEYYADPRNALWRILEPWSGPTDTSYRARCAALKRAGIGLWDVLASCERKGALDKNIRNPSPNDFHDLVGKRRTPPSIFCNGKKAYDLLARLAKLPPGIDCRVLPSTSPANARKGKEIAWRDALEEVLGSR